MIENSFLTRTQEPGHVFTALWNLEIPDDDTVFRAGRHLASLAIILWKSLGNFAFAAENAYASKADYGGIH